MPAPISDPIISASRLRAVSEAIFSGAGLPETDAGLMADALVDADLRGVHTHGTRFVAPYSRRVLEGKANPRPNLRVLRDSGASILLDGDGALGHVVAAEAMRRAIARAGELGTATVLLRNSNHCGAVAYFTQMAADAGCIGFCATTGGTRLVPTGGLEPMAGLNPLSWAVPTDRGFAINLDMAPSVVAGNKILMAAERGERIPFGWAIDENGQPTDDPQVAMKGMLLPVGGPKGYGLSVIMDILCGVFAGGRFGRDLGEPGWSQFFQAIDIEAIMPLEQFTARIGLLLDQLKSCKPAPGSTGVFLPGEIEFNLKQQRLREGVPVPSVAVESINQLASELGMPDRLSND